MAGYLIKPPSTALAPIPVRQNQIRSRDDGTWFGPLEPIKPMAPPGTQPRVRDYEPGENLIWQPRSQEAVSFADLCYMADNCDLVRVVIEDLKDQLCLLDWQIRVSPQPGESKKDTAARQEKNPKIAQWTNFLKYPNAKHTWRDFLRLLLEDLFVLDAPSILLQRTIGGQLGALHVVDGSTINLVIDDQGFTPLPPYTAYQQILQGQPAIDLTTNDLVYRPRILRARKAYGFSPVEQILTTLNIAVRRMRFQLNYYTEGNMPEGLYTMPASITEDQTRRFQEWFDMKLAGDLRSRRRLWFIPGDDKGVNRLHWTKEALLKDEADEWFARIVCKAFRISPTAFIKLMNRSTSEESQNNAEEQGVRSVADWIVETMNFIIQKKAGDTDIEFGFTRKKEADILKQRQADKIAIDSGLHTRNEVRRFNGDDPSDDPMADKLGITTGTGFIPLDQIERQNQLQEQQYADSQASGEAQFTQSNKNSERQHSFNEKQADRAHDLAERALDAKIDEGKQKAKSTNKLDKGAASWTLVKTDDDTLAQNNIDSMKSDVSTFFLRSAEQAADAVHKHFGLTKGLTKASKDEVDVIIDLVMNAVDWDELIAPVENDLNAAAHTGASIAIGQLHVSNVSLISSVSRAAQDYAHKRAAELVGKQWRNGKLVDNPNAAYRIDKTTRDEIRGLVEKAFSEETRLEDLVEAIRKAGAFSESRAKTIARTEIVRAQSLGTLDVWKSMRTVKSTTWDTSAEGPCPVCEANRDHGPVELGKAFPSGDACPPAHPNCRCALVAHEIEEN